MMVDGIEEGFGKFPFFGKLATYGSVGKAEYFLFCLGNGNVFFADDLEYCAVKIAEVAIENDFAQIVQHASEEGRFGFGIEFFGNCTGDKRRANRMSPEFLEVETCAVFIIAKLLKDLDCENLVSNFFKAEKGDCKREIFDLFVEAVVG